jgi:hypothetical protein
MAVPAMTMSAVVARPTLRAPQMAEVRQRVKPLQRTRAAAMARAAARSVETPPPVLA